MLITWPILNRFPDLKDQQTYDAPDILLALFLKKLTILGKVSSMSHKQVHNIPPMLIDHRECKCKNIPGRLTSTAELLKFFEWNT